MISDVYGTNQAHMLPKKRKGTMCSFRIKQDDVDSFDRRIKRAGFTSRSDFFTALVRIVISEPNQNPKDAASAWILNQMPPLSEEKIEQAIEDAIRKHLFAVVAIHGADVAFERTWMDLRTIVHEKTDIWTTASELRCAYIRFEDKYRRELCEHQNKILAGEMP